MYRSRVQAEAEAEAASGGSAQNRLLAASLAELLEARKTVADRTGLEALAKRYHMDVAKLERLGRVVNTPSIDENTVVRTTDKHGEESVTMVVSLPKLAHQRLAQSQNELGSMDRSCAFSCMTDMEEFERCYNTT